MTAIAHLAHNVADRHDISHAAAVDAIRAHVDQVADDPDLWDADTGELTTAGVALVTEAIAETYAGGHIATAASLLLERIADITADITSAMTRLTELTAERDELVRAALGTEARRTDIAAASGLTVGRLYQIRDGRR